MKQSKDTKESNTTDPKVPADLQAPGDLAYAIGGITLNFAYLEETLSYCVARLINPNDEKIGRTITTTLSFRSLIQLFEALYRHKRIDSLGKEPEASAISTDTLHKIRAETEEGLRDLIQRLNDENDERNRIIHSLWIPDPQTHDIHRFKVKLKLKKGLVETSTPITVEQILNTAERIRQLGEKLEVLAANNFMHWCL
jgi:hypothetical protein